MKIVNSRDISSGYALSAIGPYVYIHTDNILPIPLLPSPCLQGVISYQWAYPSLQSGIPEEWVSRVHATVEEEKVNISFTGFEKRPYKIIYYSPGNRDDIHSLLGIVAAFNTLHELDCSICCLPESIPLLSSLANEEVNWIPKQGDVQTDLEGDMIITYGSIVLDLLKKEIPVMVAGPFGIEGLVTPGSIAALFGECFKGRLGGTYRELLLPATIKTGIWEICHSDSQKDGKLQEMLRINKEIALSYPVLPADRIPDLVTAAEGVWLQFQSQDRRWDLFPVLAGSIKLDCKDEQTVTIRRAFFNDTICSMPQSYLPLLEGFDGQSTAAALFPAFGMSESDFWDFLQALWERKALLFRNSPFPDSYSSMESIPDAFPSEYDESFLFSL